MTDDPQVWHYGLMAERWGQFIHDTPELEFFRQAIAQYGQPVLDLACGAGRLLVPLLRQGIDVDGCDYSGDMLDQCRKRAELEGLQPRLFRQSMHTLALPRQYRLIYICGSFGLAGSRNNDLDTLRGCYNHLLPGGALVFNIQAEYNDVESWSAWTPEGRKKPADEWPEEAYTNVAPDGAEHLATFSTLETNPLEQTFTRRVRLEKRLRGRLVATEEYALRGNIYFKNELLLMLQDAGFRQISVTGDYTDQPATPDSEEVVFTAVK